MNLGLKNEIANGKTVLQNTARVMFFKMGLKSTANSCVAITSRFTPNRKQISEYFARSFNAFGLSF